MKMLHNYNIKDEIEKIKRSNTKVLSEIKLRDEL